ncbi:MAG: PLP-dependent aminotransferase family protein [Geminicoccaceae bacterium]
MTIWQPNVFDVPGPRYQALAEAIGTAVGDGSLPPGEKLPPQRELAFRLGVTVGTVTRAYGLAEQRGFVRGEVGRGTFVRAASPAHAFRNPVVDGDDDLIKLTVNSQPDIAAQSHLGESLAKLINGPAPISDLLAYTPKTGLDPHRKAAASWASRTGFTFLPETTLITGGAHQAIVTSIAGLARSGDTILTETLVYSGFKHVAARLGIKFQGLAVDDEGLCPDALAQACQHCNAKVLLVNPTINNPTTATMSEQRRRAIADIVRRNDLILVEDDVYGQLPEERIQPIAALIPERTIYITSASKTVAPSLRFGSLSAPESLFDRLADAQHDLFMVCPALLAALFTQWLDDGTADDMVHRQRVEAKARQALAAEILDGTTYCAQPTSYHLWLPLPKPWRSAGFNEAARARGVAIDPAFIFAVDPEVEPAAIRISLSAAKNRERLGRALHIIRATLEAGPVDRRDSI